MGAPGAVARCRAGYAANCVEEGRDEVVSATWGVLHGGRAGESNNQTGGRAGQAEMTMSVISRVPEPVGLEGVMWLDTGGTVEG